MLLDFSVSVGSQKKGVAASGVFLNELVKSSDGSSSLDDSVSSGLSDLEGCDVQGRELEKSLVVSDGSNNNGGSALCILEKSGKL